MGIEGIPQINNSIEKDAQQLQEQVGQLKLEIENIKQEQEKTNNMFYIALIKKRKELKTAKEELIKVQKSTPKEKKFINQDKKPKTSTPDLLKENLRNRSGDLASGLDSNVVNSKADGGGRVEPKPDLDWYDKNSE